MAKTDNTSWLVLKLPDDDKVAFRKMASEKYMSMSALCRQLIHKEVQSYGRFKETSKGCDT